MSDFVHARRDGEPVVVPAHWLDHPILGVGVTREPTRQTSTTATTATTKKEK